MANQTPNRVGQSNQAGDELALFNDVFTGMVMAAFEEKTKTEGMFMTRSIASGKSAEFPAMGRADAFYHVPGNEILGGAVNHGEKLIHIDGIVVAPAFIADIDQAMSQVDYRAPIADECGRALAVTRDKQILQVGALAARSTATVTDLPGGTQIDEAVAGDFDDGATLFDALEEASAIMDENEVPEDERYCFLPARRYNALARLDDLVDTDVSAGNGDKASLTVKIAAGFTLVKTNHLPSTNITGTGLLAGGARADYVGDFTRTRGLCLHKSALGTVELIGLKNHPEWDGRRIGWDYKTWQAVGHGVLRPEAAIELRAFA